MRNIFKVPKQQDKELLTLEKQLFPSILIEQASSTFLGIANTIVMGFVSTAALAGVGQVNSLNTMIFMFFNSLSQGGTVMVAQSIGAKNPERAKKSFEQALVSGFLLSIVVTIGLLLCKNLILSGLFGAVEEDVMLSSREYFSITIFATPLWFVYYQISGAMRSSGDTKTPMRATVVMNVVNIACSAVLVLLLKLGALGAGISLVVSVFSGNVVCFIKLLRSDYHLSLPKLKSFKSDLELIKLTYEVGFPVALENLMFHGGRLIVQVFVSAMGTSMISAYQVANSLCQICQLPLMASNILIVTVVGQRAGAKGKQRVRDTLTYYYEKNFTWSLYVALICFVFTYPMAWMFTRDTQVINISWGLMAIYGLFMPFFSPSFNIPQGFRGARDTKFSLIIGTTSMWLVRVVGSWFFGVYMGWQAYGIYLAMCLDWVFRAVFYIWWFKQDKWLRFVEEE